MKKMATVKWKCGKNFCGMWGGQVCDRYYSGRTYYGIPYSIDGSTLVTYESFTKKITNSKTKTIDARPGRNDCSSAVGLSMKQVDSSVGTGGTSTMYPGANGYLAVGSYTFSKNKANTCSKNGNTKMIAAYKQLQPGDCLVNDKHAILVVENNVSSGYIKMIDQADDWFAVYNPDSDSTSSSGKERYLYPRNTSWHVNQKLDYTTLFNNHYIPLTCKVLKDSDPLKPEDLGTGFYANILSTSKTSFAVTATSSDNVLLDTLKYSDYQKWYFERQSDKSYKIVNVQTGKCLDVNGAKKDNGTNIKVYNSNNSNAQRWYIIKNDIGYSLLPKFNTGSAMDITGGKIQAGTNIEEWTQNTTNAQKFSIIKTVDYQDIGKSFYANIISTKSGLAVSATSKDNVIIDTLDYSNSQKWLFEQQNDRSYKITNIANGKCLDVEKSLKDNGTNILVWNSGDKANQRWYVVNNGEGYALIPKCNINGALDITGANYKPGTNIQEWTKNTSTAQIFTISKTVDDKDIGDKFYANILSIKEGFCVSVDNQNNVVLSEIESGNDLQKWLFERQSDHSYKITNAKLKMCLEVQDSDFANGTNVLVRNADSSIGQRWYVINKGTGYSLVPKCSINSALDVAGAVFENGRNIQEWTQNTSDAQIFIISSTLYTEPESLELSENEIEINVGETRLLSATVMPVEANKRVKWLSEDEDLATVDENGMVTGVGIGTTLISATTENGITTRCKVKVSKPEIHAQEIELDNNDISLFVNETYQLTASLFPAETNDSIIWESGDDSVASVDDTGYITAANVGVTEITAKTSYGIETKCTVNVIMSFPRNPVWNGFEYSINEEETIDVTGYVYNEKDLTIPSEIDGIPVTGVISLEESDSLESVILPESIKYIWSRAFENCGSLKKVTILSAELIGDFAFANCGALETVELPENLDYVSFDAFGGCDSLKSIIIPKNVKTIRPGAFGYRYVQVEGEYGVFDGVPVEGFTVYSYNNSAGETYALENGFNFVSLDVATEPTTEQTEPETQPVIDYPTESYSTILLGDTDANGKVEINDATWIQRQSADLEIPFTISKKTADVDGNGYINVIDATAIQYYLVGMKTTYKIGEKAV